MERINLRCERTGKYVTTISKGRRQSEEEDGATGGSEGCCV